MSHSSRALRTLERRHNPGATHELVYKLYPDDEIRHTCLRFLADAIDLANRCGPSKWSVTLRERRIHLNAGRFLAVRLKSGAVGIAVAEYALSRRLRAYLRDHAEPGWSFDSAPALRAYHIPVSHLAKLLPDLMEPHEEFLRQATHGGRQSPFYRAHSPGVLEYLDHGLRLHLPRPDYDTGVEPDELAADEEEIGDELESSEAEDLPPAQDFDGLKEHLRQRGLHFPDELVSHYLLGLQVRRFVILTGISGTGKTQLALSTADWAHPQETEWTPDEDPEGAVRVRFTADMAKHQYIALPDELLPLLDLGEESAPPKAEPRPIPGQRNLPIQGAQMDMTDLPQRVDPVRVQSPMKVEFSDQQLETRLWRETPGNAVRLLLQPRLLEWLQEQVEEDGEFLIQAVGTGKKPSRYLRITVPEPQSQPRPLDNKTLVAVRPDWTDPRGLLGHYNPLTRRYIKTPFLECLLAAARECQEAKAEERTPRPFFIILDELNLARVEHYFSDFLSCLESGEPLHLHGEGEGDMPLATEDGLPVPRSLKVPPNVFFTGTVNVDETTFTFSPKVLDRAFVIEFNGVDLRTYGEEVEQEDATSFRLTRLTEGLNHPSRVHEGDWREAGLLAEGRLRERIIQLHELLAAEQRHFGYRVANEMARYLCLAAQQTEGGEESLRTALDLVILSKVLCRLHGTQQELEGCLHRLFAFMVHGDTPPKGNPPRLEDWEWRREGLVRASEGAPAIPHFPRSAAKVWRMLRRLRQQGFTSFIE
jgi:hypothetical protein